LSKLEEIEARRAARKAGLQEPRDEQRAADLEAVDALEIEHGDSNVATLEVPFTPGLPTLLAARCPKPIELKRYRDTVKTKKDGTPGDPIGAAIMVGGVCRVYPDAETFAKVLEARPGVDVQLGLAALKLASAKAEDEGKG
jgi:hypothetical protein